MTQLKSAFPASILLLTLSVPTVGQTFSENPGVGVVPLRTAPMQSPSQTPVDRSVIVVKPEITKVTDLKGKTLAVAGGVASVFYGAMKRVIADGGLDPDKDVTFLPVADSPA